MHNEELVIEYQKGNNDVLEQLYFDNLPLIRQKARVYINSMEFEDIMQEAFFAVKRAAETYNADSGNTFVAWLLCWVKWHVGRCAVTNGSYTMSVDICTKYRKYVRVLNEYRMMNGCEPPKLILRYLTGLTNEELEIMQKVKNAVKPVSLDVPLEDGENTMSDLVPDNNSQFEDAVIDKINNAELKKVLWGMVDELPEEQAAVIKKVYRDGKTVREISEESGRKYEAVRQEKDNAMRKLKNKKGRLYPFCDEYLHTRAISMSGFGAWERKGASSTEYLAIEKLMRYGHEMP